MKRCKELHDSKAGILSKALVLLMYVILNRFLETEQILRCEKHFCLQYVSTQPCHSDCSN